MTAHDGTVLGDIRIEEADFPWLRGRFTARPGFEEVRPLFAHESALLDRIDEAEEEWEAAYEAIRRAVLLVAPEHPVAEFLLHIEGDQAWFRWSEQPFEDE
ncbi:hypothetical protein ACFS5L_25820 [Streptomyces phyllanthi]|uniref:hypothetical protein n=1 Tax=Streptomyces phyllanthi TaxID=1803180 RepID=UPI002AD587A1|nr:hypothetical protein [Streptomyces phyllanthi]